MRFQLNFQKNLFYLEYNYQNMQGFFTNLHRTTLERAFFILRITNTAIYDLMVY